MNLILSSLYKIFFVSTIFILAFAYIDFQLSFYPDNITQDFYYQVWMIENWSYMTPTGFSDNFYSLINNLTTFVEASTLLKIIASISTTITSVAILYKSTNILNGIFKVLLIFSIPTIAISYFTNTRYCLAQSIVLLIFVKLHELKEKNNFLDKFKLLILYIVSLATHIFTLPLLLLPLLPKHLSFSKNINNIRSKLKNIFNFPISRLTIFKLIFLFIFFTSFTFFIIFFQNIDFYIFGVINKINWYLRNNFSPSYSILFIPLISVGILYNNIRQKKIVLEPTKIIMFIYLSIPLYFISSGQTSRYFFFGLIATIAFVPKIPIPYLLLLLFYTLYLSYVYY